MVRSYLHKQLFFIVLAVILVAVSLRIIFPPYFNIGKMQPVRQFRQSELFQEFVRDPIDAQSKYALQPILVEGRITGLDGDMILMGSGMEVIRIRLINNWRYHVPDYGYGDYILVKGICRGIDLTEVLVTHAIIVTVRK